MNASDILHVFQLSKLDPNNDEIEQFTEDFERILALFDSLNNVATDNIQEFGFVNKEVNITRKDSHRVSPLPFEECERNAPDTQDRYFKVPLVIS